MSLRRSLEGYHRAVPGTAALVVASAAIVNIVSALTPSDSWRGRVLVEVEPIEAIHVFHALALPVGTLLLVASFYLARRRRFAWAAAFGGLLALGVINLVKGLDVEEAALSLGCAALLWWARDSFHVHHDPVRLRSALWRVPLLIAGTFATACVSVGAAAHDSGVVGVAREATSLLLWQPAGFVYADEVGHVPLAIHLLGVGALVACMWLVLRPLAAPRSLPDPSLRRAAAELVRLHGDDTLSFFKLRQDIHYLFDAEQQAFMAYRVEGGVLLCSGDPVGDLPAVPGLVRTALAFGEQRGLRLGAVGVSDDVARLFEQEGLRRFYLGDEAVVDTGTFSLEGRAIRKVRQSVTRLEQAGYTFALTELGALSEDELRELESVTDTWLQGAPERGFAMAMDSVRGEHQCETLVGVTRDDEGRVRGFLHFVPTYGRAAVSLSFMRRDPETPNGLTEYLVSRSLEAFRARDVDQVSLNFAAFARLVHDPQNRLEYVLGRVISLANPFFQIESLYRFNAKFSPRWVPRYLVYSGRLGLPRAGLAAAWAEGHLPKPFVRRP